LLLSTNAPLFGEKHIIGLVFIAAVITILLLGVKKVDYQKQKNQILLFMILFYCLEIAKLAYITYTSGSFPMNHLPFQLCSLPLYLYPIMYFSKKDSKLQNIVKPAAFSIVILAGIMALAMPSTIIGSELGWLPFNLNVLPIISFTFHGLMIYTALYLVKSGFYKPNIKDYKYTVITVTPLLVAALITNRLLDKDYMSLNRGSGVPFAFLRETSQLLYTCSLIAIAFFAIYLVFVVAKFALNIKTKEDTEKTYS
jgi:uncharacterized membrane protein YwaF